MQLGLSTYSYTWSLGIQGFDYHPPVDVIGIIKKTAELDIKVLQIADNIFRDEWSVVSNRWNKVAKIADQKGIEIEIAAKGLTDENIAAYIKLCSTFKSNLLRFIIDDKSKNYTPDIQTVTSIIKNNLRIIKKQNVTLAIENHDRLQAVQFAQIIDNIGDDSVGICLDCANSLGAGEGIYETVRILAPYSVNLHLKDISITRKKHMMGFDIMGVPFGKGIIPLKWIIEQVPKRCKSMILELWMPPEVSWEATFAKEDLWVRESLEFIRTQTYKPGN